MLEEDNNKIKLDIMETLNFIMEEHNKTLINKIYSKIENIFKYFQIHLMRTTTKLVQSLQAKKQQSKNNVARFSQV